MKKILFVALCNFVVAAMVCAQRLPENAAPESYDLKFEPNLPAATFSGDEVIHVRLRAASKSIVLNSAEIEFKEVTITAGGAAQTATVAPNEKDEMVSLTVPKAIPAGPADIHIRFTGILNDKLRGFYLSQTARRRYAVTQFEATDARRAFPSFDEPAYKAIFNISLTVDKDDTAISNGHIVSDRPGPGDSKHTLKFSPSPKMSSYLVAMMVGDFACIKGDADEIPIRVCAVPEKKELLSYALLSAENILKFYDRYYSIKYPFQKLDIIAFPDFSAGAMENVAAITYRETALTIDDKTASGDAHQLVVSDLAHEMAHMWFGDLVTMKWWNDIWLNEGFATWMAWKPMESLHPEWRNELSEIQETAQALGTDSIASVRAIRGKADTTADIQTLFDGIAYGKAASVLRMIEAYLGPDTFRKGVNAYLQKHAYGNATAEDFWSQMAETSGKPVDKIMKGFTEQSGAPLVSVRSVCNGDAMQITLSQQRYFSDNAKLAAGSPEIWQIPVNLRPAGAKEGFYHLLTKRRETFDLPGCTPWIYANAEARGHYRSDYDSATLAKMRGELESTFSPEERISFLNDLMVAVRAGRFTIGEYLATLDSMSSERNRAVVETMIAPIPQFHDYLVAAADRPGFEAWVRNFLRPVAADLGDTPKPGESDDTRALRAGVIGALAVYGRDPDLVAKSRAIAEAYMRDPSSVDAALAGNALAVAAQNGDTALYEKYLEHLKTAKTPEEYYNYLGNLTAFEDPALAKRTVEFALSPAVKNRDLAFLAGLLNNYATQSVAWDLLKSNFKALGQKADATLGSGFAQLAGVFCDTAHRDDAQKFFADQHLPGSELMLRNALDQVNACIEMCTVQQSNLSIYLKNGAPASGR